MNASRRLLAAKRKAELSALLRTQRYLEVRRLRLQARALVVQIAIDEFYLKHGITHAVG